MVEAVQSFESDDGMMAAGNINHARKNEGVTTLIMWVTFSVALTFY